MAKFDDFVKSVKKNSPEILTGLGIAGFILTTVSAVQSTPRALQALEDYRYENDLGWHEDVPPKEVIKVTWKYYIPAFAMGFASMGCILGATTTNSRRNAALASAYSISQNALIEYRDKVAEAIGEKKEQKIRDAIVQDRVMEMPPEYNDVIETGHGTTLMYDTSKGIWFKSSINYIESVVNELNARLNTGSEGFVTLNEFYIELGLDPIKYGDIMGWNIEKGLISVEFRPLLRNDNMQFVSVDYEYLRDLSWCD